MISILKVWLLLIVNWEKLLVIGMREIFNSLWSDIS